jgi:selenide,water dikinase
VLLQSVDFFTPVVDDPYLFGAIAAANALSDIFAMGGRPLTAMNLVAFPACLDSAVLERILRGGIDKIHEAGATLVGGHSIEDEEPKYGLAVTGIAHPDRLVTTLGCQPGDQLVLTKPLGTGLLTTALKGAVLTAAELQDALTGMARLNRYAAEAMLRVGVRACTDITGFGLLGHGLEMAQASQVELRLQGERLPSYSQARAMAEMGLVPAGSHRNRQHYGARLQCHQTDPILLDLLSDPQTSGGLLIAVAAERLDALIAALQAAGDQASHIGEVGGRVPDGRMLLL